MAVVARDRLGDGRQIFRWWEIDEMTEAQARRGHRLGEILRYYGAGSFIGIRTGREYHLADGGEAEPFEVKVFDRSRRR